MRALVAATAVALALAPTAAAAGTPLTITVRTKQGPTVRHPHPPASLVGDTFVSSLTLVNVGRQFGRAPAARVGTMEYWYTIRSKCAALARACSATADFHTTSTLPGGTIDADGKRLSTASATIVVPVVGGTGRYAGARGTLTMGPSSTRKNVYKLRLP